MLSPVASTRRVAPVVAALAPPPVPSDTLPGVTPSTALGAPAVTAMQVHGPDAQGEAAVVWTGVTMLRWQNGVFRRYDLLAQPNGSSAYVLVTAGVYPPARATGVVTGDVLAIVPIYALPDGTDLVGAAAAVKIGV